MHSLIASAPSKNPRLKLMSLGFLIERDAPAIWRGPIIMKIVNQFLRDVDWGHEPDTSLWLLASGWISG
jgi:Mrp family chromosome partitioning ATPase